MAIELHDSFAPSFRSFGLALELPESGRSKFVADRDNALSKWPESKASGLITG